MARWDYDLKENGTKLRDLIQEGDASKKNCLAILEQMIVCCKWLQTKLTDEDKDCYELDIEEMIEDCEDTKYYLDEFDEDSNEDNMDEVLDKFYDLMDEMRVWIAL